MSSSEPLPILEKDRKNIDAWQRRFNDHCILKRWRGIFNGTELRPLELTNAQRNAIPASSRYAAVRDREKEIQDYDKRREAAFAGICRAMEKDDLIYSSRELDALRAADNPDPRAASNLIMERLRPTHVDAVMTAETQINTFAMLSNETVPAAYQRLTGYVNCLEVDNRPDDNTLKRHMKRAIKQKPDMAKLFLTKVETLMERDPPVTFDTFCQGLLRKHEEHIAEQAQEAALLTENNQSTSHAEGEREDALLTHGKGGGRGRHGRGRGRGRHMGGRYSDARIGAVYHSHGGKGYDALDHKRPFWRGGERQDGGRGYYFGGKGAHGGRNHGKGAGRGDGGKSYKPKFDGHCNKCGHYGHKEADCYSKKAKY
jgi:hypothetical protein